jgi:hypothetical protein
MAELRSSDGKYDHWGHRRVHGDVRSQEALARTHSELYLEVLRTPIAELAKEGGAPDNDPPTSGRDRFKDGNRRMVPENQRGGSSRHFNSVVLAVSLLGEAERQASIH